MPLKILLVEDEFIIATVTRKMLESLSHGSVETVASGEEAVKLVRSFQPDLLIMDVQLQGKLDGIEAVKKIHLNRSIPVVFVTGNSDPATHARMLETNNLGILNKPLSGDELKKVLESIQ